MGAVILTGAASRGLMDGRPAFPISNEPRIVVHWDGVANRKQNENMANGVVWINTQQMVRFGYVNMGLQFHHQNGVGSTPTVAVAGSFSPGALADRLKPNDQYSATMVSNETANFKEIEAALANHDVVVTTIVYTLIQLTFQVGKPGTIVITAM